jgi:antagonist of KipI
MTCRVLHAGLLTTIQDLGRRGHQREGIPAAGAMDPLALRVANLLVGNDEEAAALEITLAGPTLSFDTSTLVALAGADLSATVNGERAPPWRALRVPPRATLSFGQLVRGCRAYLAIGGGIDVPAVLGSRSTYLRAKFGGVSGRALRRDDVFAALAPSPLSRRIEAGIARAGSRVVVAHWGAGPSLVPPYSTFPSVSLLPGEHTPWLTTGSRQQLWSAEFRVGAQSDRMGYRLEGAVLELSEHREILSEAVTFGTVQLPPGGSPILLMADRQTTGGYPRIGEVATVDLPLVAQLKPGDRLRFRPISLEEAQRQYFAREAEFAQARAAVALRHR